MCVRDANVMRDGSCQRARRVTRIQRHAHTMGGVTASSNVRTDAASADVYARCEYDAGWQSSARMQRDAHRAARARHERREGVEQRTS